MKGFKKCRKSCPGGNGKKGSEMEDWEKTKDKGLAEPQ
jgi:hypothetical protein